MEMEPAIAYLFKAMKDLRTEISSVLSLGITILANGKGSSVEKKNYYGIGSLRFSR